MTKEQFAARLIEKLRVDFGGSVISAPSIPIAERVAETIKLGLPDGEVVAHAVQIGTLSGSAEGWEGNLILLLSLRSHLLALTADVRYEGTGPQRTSKLHVEYRLHRKERVRVNLRVRWGGVLEQAHLSLDCDGSAFEIFSGPSLTPEALCRFAATSLA